MGKTSLGLRWLHQIRDRFGDGQLFADLRGFSGTGPVPLSEPLEGFLRALGVAAADLPVGVAEQAALYRSLTAGRRLIIMLDNAATAAQVRPLLPGHGPALVVVTARHRLSGLATDGAVFVTVGTFDETDAVRLLDRMLGPARTAAEPQAALALARLCGRLPLALCTSAARLVVRRGWPIARVVEELADARQRLSTLSVEDDLSVRAVFDVSYRGIAEEAGRLFRLLALHPGPDFDAGSAGALAGIGPHAVHRLLDSLADANLLSEDDSARFRFHDLLRLYAGELAEFFEPAESLAAAFTRLLDHYLAASVAADRVLIPDRWHLGSRYDQSPSETFDGTAAALEWLERELPGILAVQRAAHHRELHEAVWGMSEALWGLFILRKPYRAWVESYQLGLGSARACGNPRAQARMLCGLGWARLNLQEFDSAHALYLEAIRLDHDAGHALGEAAALEGLGVSQLGLGNTADAAEAFTQALTIHQAIGRARGVALMTRRLGEAMRDLGRYAEAIEHLTETRAYFVAHGDLYNEARVLTTLADVLLLAARPAEAGDVLDRALQITVEVGARHEQAQVHAAQARLAERLGDGQAQRGLLRAALALYRALEAPQAPGIAARLAALEAEPNT
ncbi:MAG: tetratricopeptide repeat protein [Streptosporangiaceae bacterium]